MKIVVLGKNGQLGWELRRSTLCLGSVIALDFPEIDLIHPEQTCQLIREKQPDLILNATAYTQVDRAEDEPETAQAVNGLAPGILARTAADSHAAFIHFSTDYVFDGKKGSAYVETDEPHPLNTYGRSKLAGETAVQEAGGAFMILRTSWVYSARRDSFVKKVLHWARKKDALRVVSDQIGSPTWARTLAEITTQMVVMGKDDIYNWIKGQSGLYHLGGSGCCSRFEWAKAILSLDPHPELQMAKKITPVSSAEFPTAAERPANTCLDCSLFYHRFGLQLPDWETSLKLALEEQ